MPMLSSQFERMQKVMPLHVIASSLKTERSLSLSYEAGNFWDLESLAKCMKGESVSWLGLYF